MANTLHESLSALMDNEADEFELRRVLKEMESVAEEPVDLKAKWHRYHVVSASLKKEIHSSPSRNLLAAIQAELEQDAVPTRTLMDSASRKGVFRRLGQGAIAASVALSVLFTADLVLEADTTINAGNPTQLADSETAVELDQLPGFTGDLNPATNTRIAVQNKLSPEEMRRLERTVSAELEDVLATRATFDPDSDR